MELPYVLADVFTDRVFGGNSLAVFTEAAGLSPELMQSIARELNLSETVFVLPPEDPRHTRHVRIFTPAIELPFAGHPTVGTACVLGVTGAVTLTKGRGRVVLEEAVGPVPVEVSSRDGRRFATFTVPRLPETGPPPPSPGRLADLLSIEPGELAATDGGPRSVSCGVPFLFVPVKDRTILARVRLDLAVWEAEIARSWAPHVYAFTRDAERPGSSVRARMFAPAMGIQEDPATGAAAAALAGYLGALDTSGDGTLRWRVEQGVEMGRPSLIDVEADREDGRIVAVRVGGETVLVGKGVLELPD